MTTVVIAAHNEAAVIGRCLDAVLADAHPGEFEVVVAANGCTDDTAAIAARRTGVRVVEIEQASKIAALNSAEAAGCGFPRIYLDADIPASTATVRAVRDALQGPDAPLAAFPARKLDVARRPIPVRAYYAIHSRLPVFQEGLFGRGMIGLSQAGRERFGVFPDVVADDLFLDTLFAREETVQVPHVSTTVATPMRTRDLTRRLVRVRRGNAALRGSRDPDHASSSAVRRADRLSWYRDVVVPHPWLAPAAVVYVTLSAWAALRARRQPSDPGAWERDDSSRVPGLA